MKYKELSYYRFGLAIGVRNIFHNGFRLGFWFSLCFIIGLPSSSISSELASVKPAKSLKLNWIYWNLFQPHLGTSARSWFEENGRIFGEENKNSLIGLTLSEQEAPCNTPDFPAEERKRMKIRASLMTGTYWLNPRYFVRYIRLVSKHHLGKAFLTGLPAAFRINLEMFRHKSGKFIRNIFRTGQ